MHEKLVKRPAATAVFRLHVGESALEGRNVGVGERREVGHELRAANDDVRVGGDGILERVQVVYETSSVVGGDDLDGESVWPELYDLVVLVEEVFLGLGRAAADDQVVRRGNAHQPRKRKRKRRIAEARGRDLVGGRAGNVVADVSVRAHRRAVVLVVATVRLGELGYRDTRGKVHPELAAHKPAVKDVVRVFVRLYRRLKDVLALVKMLCDAPLLEAKKDKPNFVGLGRLALDDIDAAVARAHDRSSRKRAGDAPDVDELDVVEKPHKVEDDVANVEVAERRERRIASAVELVPERIENHLATVDAGPGKPFDLAVELWRDALDEILLGGIRLIGAGRDGGAHRIAPVEVLDRLLAQLSGERHSPVLRDLVDRRPESAVVERVDVKVPECLLDLYRRCRRKDVDLGMPHAVALLEERDNLLHLRTILVRRQSRYDVVAAGRHIAGADGLVVVVNRLFAYRHTCAFDDMRHVLLRNRRACHAPVLAAVPECVPDFRRMSVEEADPALVDELLNLFVCAERKIHAVGIGPDEHMVFGEDEIDGLLELRFLFGGGQRLKPGGGAILVEVIDPHRALHGVDAALGHETRRLEKHRPHAAQQRAVPRFRENRFSYDLHRHIIPNIGPVMWILTRQLRSSQSSWAITRNAAAVQV